LDDLREAGVLLCDHYGVPFLMKGGHLTAAGAIDLLVEQKRVTAFRSTMVAGVNSHGSGCTFSAAIAANLAKGRPLPRAVAEAKAFISGSLKRSHALKPGTRVIDHFYRWR
jgi:hydroxymethylpyrimidine/phosphomethylpyrimidine kinase